MPAQVGELAHHLQRFPSRLQPVESDLLACEADPPADLVPLRHDVVAGNAGPAAVGTSQGGQDTYGSGLACAVRPSRANTLPAGTLSSRPARAVLRSVRLGQGRDHMANSFGTLGLTFCVVCTP